MTCSALEVSTAQGSFFARDGYLRQRDRAHRIRSSVSARGGVGICWAPMSALGNRSRGPRRSASNTESNGPRDLFDPPDDPAGSPSADALPRPIMALDDLDGVALIAAIRNAGVKDYRALVAEAGRRRLGAAIPALEALCLRFTGFGAGKIVGEQAAALEALALIGSPDAAQSL